MLKKLFYFTNILIDCWSSWHFFTEIHFSPGEEWEGLNTKYKTEDNVWVYKLEITKELKAQVFVVVFKNWSISHLGSVSLYIYSANPLWRNVLLLWKIIASDISDKSFLLSQKPDLSWRKIRYWNFFTQLLNTWEWLWAGNGCWV